MKPLLLRHYTATTCSGSGKQALLDDLLQMRSALAPCTFDTVDFPAYTGSVPGLDAALPAAWQRFDCRNNRLAWLGNTTLAKACHVRLTQGYAQLDATLHARHLNTRWRLWVPERWRKAAP